MRASAWIGFGCLAVAPIELTACAGDDASETAEGPKPGGREPRSEGDEIDDPSTPGDPTTSVESPPGEEPSREPDPSQEGPVASPAEGTPADPADPEPGAFEQPLRRLSHFEYQNTLRDLFADPELAVPALAADETIDGFSNHWDGMQPSPLLTEQYYSAALSIARGIDAARAQELTGCDDATCAESFITTFGRRAFRRPLTESEVSTFLALFTTDPGASDVTLAVQLTVMAMLQSPHFLYRPEFGTGEATDERGRPLDAYETASRLSYLIWATMPDDSLFEAAETGALMEPDVIEAEARRLLADARSRQGVSQFFSEWLKLSRLENVLKLPEAGWDEPFRRELIESALRFTLDEVFFSGGTSADLMTSTRFPATTRVATLLGSDGGSDDYEVVVADPEQRSGFLTHPAFLGAHGYGDYPSPVLRGVYLLDRILCAPPSPPPGNVAIVLPEAPEERPAPRTNREAYVEATSGAECLVCHTLINGFGFAFEHYDTLGQYRETDSGIEVDASGSLAGFDFASAVDLSAQLSVDPRFQACLVEKWVNFAVGGSPLADDARFRLDLERAFEASGFQLQELLVAIATHERYARFLATTEVTP